METLIGALLGACAGRIRGGGIDAYIAKILKKPPLDENGEPWGAPNKILMSVWALFVTLSLPFGWHSIFVFAFAFLGVWFGYFHQIAKYFGFPSGFNLALKENRTWKNYALLSARGAFIMLPLALTYGSLYFQLWLAAAAGLLFVPCYLADNYLKKYVNMYWNWGELLLYGAIGGALCL